MCQAFITLFVAILASLIPVSVSAQTVPQPNFITNGLMAYYPFDGNAKDASGNENNGTLNGVVPSNDRFGNRNSAYHFDGKSSVLAANSASLNPANQISISVWFKADNWDGYNPRLVSKGNYNINATTERGLRIMEFGVTTLNASSIASGLPTVNEWHHLIAIYNGSSIGIYMDGKNVIKSIANGGSILVPPVYDGNKAYSGLYIGQKPGDLISGNGFWIGEIDDVRIYNRALSDDEVAALYKYESTPPDNSFITNGLVAYYPFNSGANDSSGNGNGGLVNGATPTADRFGLTARAYRFDAFGQNITTTNANGLPVSTNDFTISFWVSVESDSGTHQVFLSNAAEEQFKVHIGPLQNGAAQIGFQSGGTGAGATPAISWTLNHWYNVQVVRSQNKNISIYRDGVRLSQQTTTLGNNAGPTQRNLTIGADRVGTKVQQQFYGALDDLRIYNRGLSAGELSALYEYESVPQKSDPRQATAAATVVNGFVVGATITDSGSGYTKAPQVVISGGGGSGATATATIDANGSVTGITIVSSGSKYTGIPTITIDAPPFPPSQAKGTATLINGFVTGVNITDGGHGYEGVIPPVTFIGGGGTGAKGTAIVNNGIVTGISMTASGSGYTKAPYALIAAPPGLARAEISVHSVDVTLHLIPGYTYKIQTAIDAGSTWVDVETGILAVDATLVRTFDVTTNTQLFRVVQTN